MSCGKFASQVMGTSQLGVHLTTRVGFKGMLKSRKHLRGTFQIISLSQGKGACQIKVKVMSQVMGTVHLKSLVL